MSEEKSIQLSDGSTVTLTADVTFLELPTEDRDFVFRLSDAMDKHEAWVMEPDDGEG